MYSSRDQLADGVLGGGCWRCMVCSLPRMCQWHVHKRRTRTLSRGSPERTWLRRVKGTVLAADRGVSVLGISPQLCPFSPTLHEHNICYLIMTARPKSRYHVPCIASRTQRATFGASAYSALCVICEMPDNALWGATVPSRCLGIDDEGEGDELQQLLRSVHSSTSLQADIPALGRCYY